MLSLWCRTEYRLCASHEFPRTGAIELFATRKEWGRLVAPRLRALSSFVPPCSNSHNSLRRSTVANSRSCPRCRPDCQPDRGHFSRDSLLKLTRKLFQERRTLKLEQGLNHN